MASSGRINWSWSIVSAGVAARRCRTRWGTAPRPRMTTRARAEFIFTLKFIYILISSDDDHDRSAIRGYARLTAVRDRYLIY